MAIPTAATVLPSKAQMISDTCILYFVGSGNACQDWS